MENKNCWLNSGNIRINPPRTYNSIVFGFSMKKIAGWSIIPLPIPSNFVFILFLNTLEYYDIEEIIK